MELLQEPQAHLDVAVNMHSNSARCFFAFFTVAHLHLTF